MFMDFMSGSQRVKSSAPSHFNKLPGPPPYFYWRWENRTFWAVELLKGRRIEPLFSSIKVLFVKSIFRI